MSHEIETTAWVNEKPWHGLGEKVDPNLSAEQMLKAAGLNWQVEKVPLKTTTGNSVKDFFALQRSSDKSILDVVGKQYTPVQNADAFKFFKEFVEAGKAKMDTAGSLKQGRMVWGLASLGAGFKIKGKDEVKGYVLVACPHEQGKSFQIKFTAVRVVCNNTLTIALKNKDAENVFRMAHRRSFDQTMIEMAKETLGIANNVFDEFNDTITKLASRNVSDQKAHAYLANVFQPELKDAPVKTIIEKANKPMAYALQALTHAPGAQLITAEGTAWGLLNAVTYTTDHLLGRSNDTRLQKAWFGRTAILKQKALQLATEL